MNIIVIFGLILKIISSFVEAGIVGTRVIDTKKIGTTVTGTTADGTAINGTTVKGTAIVGTDTTGATTLDCGEGERKDINGHPCCQFTIVDVNENDDYSDYDYWYYKDVYDCYDPKSGAKVHDPLARCIKKNLYTLECCDDEGNCSGYTGPTPRDSYCFYSDGHQICA